VAALEAVGKHAAHEREEKDGSRLQDGVKDSRKGLWLIFQISQLCVSNCIQVPMAEVKAPIHIRRIPVMKSFEDPLDHGGAMAAIEI